MRSEDEIRRAIKKMKYDHDSLLCEMRFTDAMILKGRIETLEWVLRED